MWGFFYAARMDEIFTCPTLGASCIPRRWRPLPTPAHPERRHTTGSRADHAKKQSGQVLGQTDAQTLDTLHRSALDTRQATPGRSYRRQCWRAGSSSIMRIVIALSQAWYIDSNMNKYHKDILLFIVIVNYYLSIDI